jgi:hypothetical protein
LLSKEFRNYIFQDTGFFKRNDYSNYSFQDIECFYSKTCVEMISRTLTVASIRAFTKKIISKTLIVASIGTLFQITVSRTLIVARVETVFILSRVFVACRRGLDWRIYLLDTHKS